MGVSITKITVKMRIKFSEITPYSNLSMQLSTGWVSWDSRLSDIIIM